MINKKHKSALSTSKGVQQPSNVNIESIKNIRDKRKNKSNSYQIEASQIIKEIKKGNRTILSQAITLVESTLPEHQNIANKIVACCLPFSGNSIRIGISGVPGVGKSTFIETYGKHLISKGKKLAVLAIDPSSEFSKGSILGDKTRMEELANDANAFIRPSPSSGLLGGVARHTRQAIILCEAAGFDTIFVETVGVGQSETIVNTMVDMFLLLMLAGAGDELQGIKRGIMEMADIVAINKADGSNIKKAEIAAVEYRNALHLYPSLKSKWIPQVVTCSAITKKGIPELADLTLQFISHVKKSRYFNQKRKQQAKQWLYETIDENLKQNFYEQPKIKAKLIQLEQQVLSGKISPITAANKILKIVK
ncbi:MAG: methylmalonyl Co-A mutase-associated GTPase MeaB [Bacteroidetes bacterium CG_4_10_14_3_um_filter_31_20]|nr:methylmalonyl Co-A mutase-associated GTPase MeaB [Bacteroidota bacterium]PIY05997.1 MAG: methylmalonyl Co-A mutase-associated GTPase MeaB [Bacteroidetes bacterium CG_4_10_14_3_um_filter_31_20]